MGHRDGSPVFALSSSCRVPLSLPRRDPRTHRSFRGPWTAAFPLSAGGRLSRFTFSGPAQHSLALWPASSLSCLKQPFDIGGSRPFVISRTTPTASGWNDPVAGVGFAPTGHTTPITAHAEPRERPGGCRLRPGRLRGSARRGLYASKPRSFSVLSPKRGDSMPMQSSIAR
jgi:hypothetical protein